MGCLPPILLVLVGFGLGFLWDGRGGALIGAGLGMVLGVLLAIPLFRFMRRANRRQRSG